VADPFFIELYHLAFNAAIYNRCSNI